jgi:transposase
LHPCGLLSASFRPEAEMCAVRAYLRHRAMLLEYRAAHIQHMQKALHQMHVQLSQVLTDVTGVTGLAIIRAIVEGERDPVHLARFREPQCAHSTEDIEGVDGTNRVTTSFTSVRNEADRIWRP